MLINTQLPGTDHASLSIDNYGGARAMMQHLVEAGHRRIAFIAGPEDNFDAHERLRGYRDALAESLPDAQTWVLQGDFDEASGHRAGRDLLAAETRPDAVFAANDMMALGCLFAFNQAGVQLPRDIALVGFDDIPLARYVYPSLTTMRVNIAELGGRALRALLDLPQSPPPQQAPLTPELIVRESSLPNSPARARADSS